MIQFICFPSPPSEHRIAGPSNALKTVYLRTECYGLTEPIEV